MSNGGHFEFWSFSTFLFFEFSSQYLSNIYFNFLSLDIWICISEGRIKGTLEGPCGFPCVKLTIFVHVCQNGGHFELRKHRTGINKTQYSVDGDATLCIAAATLN